MTHPKITILWNSTVKEFKGAEGGVLTTVVVQSVDDADNVTDVPADAAFVAIGHIPNTGVRRARARARTPCAPVSYTHLTLPTICSV
eukprot:486364-Prymnesium_polylepis.1